METRKQIENAAKALKDAHYAIAFTGAGISVESGVPPFRGSENSIWSKYDPECLDLDYFYAHPAQSWEVIKEIFYNFMFKTEIHPNTAHIALAKMESMGIIKSVVTQNIDFLHQEAGSKHVYEFHGTAGRVICTNKRCGNVMKPQDIDLNSMPPKCPKCGSLLKPDFVFFGEGIPQDVYEKSMSDAEKADVVVVVGTTGEVMPAGMIPIIAKRHGATIIEINPTKSALTTQYTDIHIAAKAGEAFAMLAEEMGIEL